MASFTHTFHSFPLLSLFDSFKRQAEEAAPNADNAAPVKLHRKLTHAQRGLQHDPTITSQATPSQTFYIPLPEKDVFHDLLKPIADGHSCYGDMISMISVAISTDNTVIWYDHWEDGYDTELYTGSTSEIWGDGDASNGCRPDVENCEDDEDVLHAGDSFVIQQSMDNQRAESGEHVWSNEGIKYDGRDKLKASFPITMTRGGYASTPGSLLAGAVEVYDTTIWGTEFEAPVGYDTVHPAITTDPFEYSRVFVMASKPGTYVYLPDGGYTILNEGQSTSFNVKQGDSWTASEPVQADLCVGDINSNYEMRWFSLLPTELWSTAYLTPLGDSHAYSKMVLYNPGNTAITVDLVYRVRKGNTNSDPDSDYDTIAYTIPSKGIELTRFIPTDSGATVTLTSGPTDAKFIALSMTDTQERDADNDRLNGQCYDWGFPVVPINQLTPQVLIGWGFGCTNNDCDGKTERSAVWVSPMEWADIYIDYQNTGGNYEKITLKKFQSAMIRDKTDTDMSGALIFATQKDSGPDGPPVDIAAAWGQDPAVSRASQSISLDLGTVVLPFTTIRVQKTARTIAQTGEELTYTIKIVNVGQTMVPAGGYTIVDPLVVQGTYKPGTTKYSSDGGTTYSTLTDGPDGTTPYLLDEGGLPSQADLPRRGGVHMVQFTVYINPNLVDQPTMVNTGYVIPPFGPHLPFTTTTHLNFSPSITVSNTVYKGDAGVPGCSDATESVTDVVNTVVTYCFHVVNTGNTFLQEVNLSNEKLGYNFDIGTLGPGEYVTKTFTSTIPGDKDNLVVASGIPSLLENTIPPNTPITATDPSEVFTVLYNPSITLSNTVYKGHSGAGACSSQGVEKVFALPGSAITYCFKIENTGNTHLKDLSLSDPIADNYINNNVIDLPAGESTTVAYEGLMPDLSDDDNNDLENVATVTATPSLTNGNLIGQPDVQAVDPSHVGNIVNIETMSGNKTPFEDPDVPNCMEDAWEDAGNTQNLVCRDREVFIHELHSQTRTSCDLDTLIVLNVDAWVHFNTQRFDPGWYVARDGGDALRGLCAISGLLQDHSYQVVNDYEDDTAQVVGSVAWNADENGEDDVCGDLIVNGGGGADILVPLLEDVEVKCVDYNGDGNLDVSVCFSWRHSGHDDTCSLTFDDPHTQGAVPDLFPAAPSQCFCARYDIPEITVVPHDDDHHVSPC